MAIEIERKFLLKNDDWRKAADSGRRIQQGYLPMKDKCSIRIRLTGDKAALNIKGATLDITRTEYDYPIPLDDARELIENFCVRPIIEKVRYHVNQSGHLWEIDVFEGENQGLIVAEIELDSVDEKFETPDWLGKEVSDDPRYYNVSLIDRPYNQWTE